MDFNQAYEKIRTLENRIEALESENLELRKDVRVKIGYNIKLRNEVNDLEKSILKKIEVQANHTGNKGLFIRLGWLLFGFKSKPFINQYR